jgi:adenylate cyclase
MMSSLDRIPIHRWLIARGMDNTAPDLILQGFCDRVTAAGLPLARGFAGLSTLHPLINAYSFVWAQGQLVQETFSHQQGSSEVWQASPFAHMIGQGLGTLRQRLEPPDQAFRFQSWQDFAGRGMTDWLGLLFSFGWEAKALSTGRVGLVTSWMSDRPGGFTDPECEILQELAGTLAMALKGSAAYPVMEGLLATYLGRDAATHVLAGEVQLGRVHGIDAAIFFADLRDFTVMSERLGDQRIAEVLNLYLDRIGSSVQEFGGQVLKFMGDGILATFAVSGDPAASCGAALAAAEQAVARVESLNAMRRAEGAPWAGVDVALHLGTVLYGNVGAADRLDFTVVGTAVNEASRIEGLCRAVDRPVLLSRRFRDALLPAAQGRLTSMGTHALRNVLKPVEVFAPV